MRHIQVIIFAIACIRGRPLPGFRPEGRRIRSDDRVDLLGQDAIRRWHGGYRRQPFVGDSSHTVASY